MSQDFDNYSIFHIIPKSLERVRLFKDDSDKQTFISILANTCLELNTGLLAFDVINTHAHSLVGIRETLGISVTPNCLEQKISEFCKILNRRYGLYYRKKHRHSSRIYKKNEKIYTQVFNTNGFLNEFNYINRNACAAGVYRALEDNPFTSYNYFLACFVQNPEIQNLAVIQKITTSPDFLPIFNALDFEFCIKQYKRKGSLQLNVEDLVSSHVSELRKLEVKYKNSRFTDRYKVLKLDHLTNNPRHLQVKNTKGHKVKRFIEDLANIPKGQPPGEINGENFKEYFHAFSAFFPWNDQPLKESLALIRKNYPTQFDSFISAFKGKIGINTIKLVTGIRWETLNNITQGLSARFPESFRD